MIYKEKSDIFNLLICRHLSVIRDKIITYKQNSAGFLTLEEGYLHKTKLAYAYTSLGGVNAFIS